MVRPGHEGRISSKATLTRSSHVGAAYTSRITRAVRHVPDREAWQPRMPKKILDPIDVLGKTMFQRREYPAEHDIEIDGLPRPEAASPTTRC